MRWYENAGNCLSRYILGIRTKWLTSTPYYDTLTLVAVELTLMLGNRTLSMDKKLCRHFGSRNLTCKPVLQLMKMNLYS